MRKTKRVRLVLLFTVLCGTTALGQQHKFGPGESITYSVYYHLWGVWVGAGEVTFTVESDEFLGKPCLKFNGEGATYKRYDWFYKVRDTYTAFSHPDNLKPYRFSRNISEGSFFMREENIYDYQRHKIYSVLKVKENPIQLDTIDLKPNSYDVLSLIYHVRDIDFSKVKPGEKIPIRMVIDRETYDLYVRYIGVKTYKHSELGEVECYVFSPLLVEGTIFKDGERMTVWVTTDRNTVPVYIESEIRVGSIRAELTSWKGLKEPLLQKQ
ncbi:MAG: hypothetical protein Kow0075_03510 [Salibacteraceae bacterium]